MNSTSVICRKCGDLMPQRETMDHPPGGLDQPHIEAYECQRCSLRAVVMFEPVGGSNPEQTTWVEEQVAQRGSFFPTDWTGSRGPRFGSG